MAEPCPHPVALRWDGGPELLRKLKNKLLLYFQSKNKSHGGECQLRELDCSRGYIVIHFREQTVRDQVLQKSSHEITLPGGERLALEVSSLEAAAGGAPKASAKPGREETTPSSPAAKISRQEAAAEQIPFNLVLIQNVQRSCSPEMLTLLIERVSDRSEDDFDVEIIPEIQAAVVTFTCDIDVSGFIQDFCRNHRVTKQNLTAKPLEETRSLRVEGLPPRTEEDHLLIYFESPKLGGGQVEKVVMLPKEEAALVTFCDGQAVKVLVEKEHIFSKKQISVYRYYPALGVALYGKQGPSVVSPQPIERPISPYLLEFIWIDANLKQSMEKSMSEKMCEIMWPDPKCSNPVITLCFPTSLSSHLRMMVKVSHTWTDNVSEAFSLLMSRYKVIECKMNPIAWEDIRGQVSSSADYNRVLVKPNAEAEKVFLSGTMKDVKNIEERFRSLVKEISEKVERNSRVITMKEAMSEALYHVIDNSGLKEKILADIPELKMEYEKSTHNLLLTGVREEVLQAKCEILSVRNLLKSKSMQLNPHVIQFLMVANPNEVSSILFVSHHINAVIEVEDGAIRLTAYSKKDLTEAEEQITRELMHQRIAVEDKSVLRSPEWGSLQSHLDSFNSETCTILVQVFPSGAEDEVVVSGFSSNVQKSYKEIHEFIEANTPMQKIIRLQSRAVMDFIKEERKLMFEALNQINVRVVVGRRNLQLIGTKTYVEEGASHVLKVSSSLHSDTLHINKPGAKKFCLANEELYVTMAKKKYKCVLHLQKDDEGDDDIPNATTVGDDQYQIQLPQGVTVSVHRGDLCRHKADVVVNAANEDLKHIGGLAMALLTAAGHKLQTDCDRIVKQKGRLLPGQSVITDAGDLPCKQVIHTVGPRWTSSSPQRCKDLLQKAIGSSLALAAEHGHRSIAIPAVSSGIFGFPVDVCAQNIVEAIKNFVEGEGSSSLVTRIDLVDTKDETIAAFTKSLQEKFGDLKLTRYSVKKAAEAVPEMREEGATESPERTQKVVTEVQEGLLQDATVGATPHPSRYSGNMGGQGVVIRVKEGLLQDATTDVIVNSVGRDLRLDSGGASKALYEKAGSQLQAFLSKEASGAQAADGDIFVTPGGNLSCNIIIHVVVPSWDRGKGSAEKVFRQTMQTCLQTAEQRQQSSITFPAIGTGNLGFPRSRAASIMFEEVHKFSSKSRNASLRQATFMLHPGDKETIQEFYKEQSGKKSRNPAQSNRVSSATTETRQKASSGAAFYGAVKTLSLGLHEMRVGAITYQVKTGDLTKEDTDVIVNSTNETFNLMSGVSKSILEAAGPSVQDDCAQLASQNKKSTHITTQGGNLLCKRILHVVGRNSAEGIKDFASESLQECESLGASSVALPAIGTGLGNVSSAVVADILLEAITDFARSGSAKKLQVVKVVIFQQHMLDDFYDSMKKKEGADLPKQASLLNRWAQSFMSFFASKPGVEKEPKVFELCENIEPVIFHLCGDTKKAVSDASSWLRDLILKEQHENLITDDWILEFGDQEHRTLSQDQRRLGVLVSFQSPGATVKISGLTRDVLEMTNKIQAMIKNVREKKTKEREAELCSNLVEWRYHDGSTSVPFDPMTNLELETAKSMNKATLQIEVSGVTYTVVMEQSSMRDPKGKARKIERISKDGPSELPADWTPMTGGAVAVITLKPGSPEYSEVEAEFMKSCQMRIAQIERIQNKNLWMNYQIKKQAFDAKNGATVNEKRLFHGTDATAIKNVIHNGFNRSYAGKNAAVYGNGTYFAVNANYSAHDQYSVPDGSGLKYMYLARVLTGEFCAGQRGMLAPPAKNPSDPTDLYDCVTDNTANPSMFVIFHDIQAYPEYLITFSK